MLATRIAEEGRNMELALTSRTVESFEIIEVGGEIDVYTAPKLREAIVAAVDAGHIRLIIDVQRVDFLDSTGLGVLVGALKRVRADGGSLDIVCTQERILKIFEITGLDKVFGLHSSIDDARAAHA
jgi:anti-sigma B factor antagonist